MTGTVSLTGFKETPGDGSKVANINETDNALWVAIKSSPSGGMAVTIADGADVALGAKADAEATSDTGTFSLIALIKRLLTRFAAPSNASNSAYAASLVIKNAAGTLYQCTVFNSGPAQFVQLHDAAAVPSDAAVPVAFQYVPANGSVSFDYGQKGRAFANGIVVCNSSTGPTKTIGSANCWTDAQYS